MKMKYCIPFLLAGFMFFSSCGNKKKTNEKAPVSQEDTIPQKKVVPPASALPKDTVAQNEGVRLSDNYFLVMNSYTVKEFAEAANRECQKEGFNSAVFMRNGDGYYRLALKSFTDFNRARKEMIEMKKNPKYKHLWILVK